MVRVKLVKPETPSMVAPPGDQAVSGTCEGGKGITVHPRRWTDIEIDALIKAVRKVNCCAIELA
jgi:hypothetical protein